MGYEEYYAALSKFEEINRWHSWHRKRLKEWPNADHKRYTSEINGEIVAEYYDFEDWVLPND